MILGALLSLFGVRLAKTRKLILSGMLLILTLVTLALVYAWRPS